ncbi:hypothetical protein Tco_1485468 [Tanacetum coccineum]
MRGIGRRSWGRKLCTIVDTLTQWEPHSMLATTFSSRYTVCNTLYREMKFQRRQSLTHSIQVAFSIAMEKTNVASVQDVIWRTVAASHMPSSFKRPIPSLELSFKREVDDITTQDLKLLDKLVFSGIAVHDRHKGVWSRPGTFGGKCSLKDEDVYEPLLDIDNANKEELSLCDKFGEWQGTGSYYSALIDISGAQHGSCNVITVFYDKKILNYQNPMNESKTPESEHIGSIGRFSQESSCRINNHSLLESEFNQDQQSQPQFCIPAIRLSRIKVEQLCPFRNDLIQRELKHYPGKCACLNDLPMLPDGDVLI